MNSQYKLNLFQVVAFLLSLFLSIPVYGQAKFSWFGPSYDYRARPYNGYNYYVSAADVSDDGTMVVGNYGEQLVNTTCRQTGFLWNSQTNVITYLKGLQGSACSFYLGDGGTSVSAISSDGKFIVGSAYSYSAVENGSSTYYNYKNGGATVWDTKMSPMMPKVIENGQYAYASCISSAGSTYYIAGSGGGNIHGDPKLWVIPNNASISPFNYNYGPISYTGDLGKIDVLIRDISKNHTLVGYYNIRGGFESQRSFVTSPNNSLTELRLGNVNNYATAISSDGSTVVGRIRKYCV